MNKVFLGIPTSDLKVHPDIIAAVLHASPKGQLNGLRTHSYSCLTRNFNELYCAALNARKEGITHFCMLHSDVVPHGMGWLDIMLEIMQAHQTDVLSAIIPIKDNKGFTSTALDTDQWRPRRLTMTEICKEYPETFTRPDLLINTGLMLIDIRKPWVEQCHFMFLDTIQNRDGIFYAENSPEDWEFSRDARLKGAKIFATRAIGVTHYGHAGYINAHAQSAK